MVADKNEKQLLASVPFPLEIPILKGLWHNENLTKIYLEKASLIQNTYLARKWQHNSYNTQPMFETTVMMICKYIYITSL